MGARGARGAGAGEPKAVGGQRVRHNGRLSRRQRGKSNVSLVLREEGDLGVGGGATAAV